MYPRLGTPVLGYVLGSAANDRLQRHIVVIRLVEKW